MSIDPKEEQAEQSTNEQLPHFGAIWVALLVAAAVLVLWGFADGAQVLANQIQSLVGSIQHWRLPEILFFR